MTTTQDKWLEEILSDYSGMDFCGDDECHNYWLCKEAIAKIKSHILSEALEIIGEDEYLDGHFSTVLRGKDIERYDRVTARDRLRAELRQKFKERFDSKEESVGRE